MNDLPFCWQNT